MELNVNVRQGLTKEDMFDLEYYLEKAGDTQLLEIRKKVGDSLKKRGYEIED